MEYAGGPWLRDEKETGRREGVDTQWSTATNENVHSPRLDESGWGGGGREGKGEMDSGR